MSVQVSISRGKTLATDEKVDNAKLNAGFLPSISITGAFPLDNDSFIVVEQGTTPSINGSNLGTAWAEAEVLTPGGNALSATNRAAVLIPPGNYLRTTQFNLQSEFIDLIGLGEDPRDVRIYGDITTVSTGVVHQTVSDVRIENLMIENTADSGAGSAGEASDPCAYFVTGGLTPLLKNVRIKADGTNASPMRPQVDYAGTYEDVIVDGPYGFGGGDPAAATSGTMSGTMRRCRAGKYTLGTVTGEIWGLECDGLHMNGSGTQNGTIDGLICDMQTAGQSECPVADFVGLLTNSRIVIATDATDSWSNTGAAQIRNSHFKGDSATDTVTCGGTGANIQDSTFINDGSGNALSLTNNHAVYHCRLNKAISGGTNDITSPNNVVDASVS